MVIQRKVVIVLVAAMILTILLSVGAIASAHLIEGDIRSFVVNIAHSVPVEISAQVELDSGEVVTVTAPITVNVELRVSVDGNGTAKVLEDAVQEPTITERVASAPSDTVEIVLIGHPSPALQHAAAVGLRVQGRFKVYVNTIVPSADLVLVTVYSPDGPMPGTVAEIERQQGQTLARVAILFTGADLLNDPELQELELLEVNELLSRYIGDARLEVLRDSDPNLITKLQALLLLPSANIRINERNR